MPQIQGISEEEIGFDLLSKINGVLTKLESGGYTGTAQDIIDSIASVLADAQYIAGVTPTSVIVPATGNVYTVVTTPGTYVNWNNIVVPANTLAVLSRVDGVFSSSQSAVDFDSLVSKSELATIFDYEIINPINWWHRPLATNGRYEANGTYLENANYYTTEKVALKSGETIRLGYFPTLASDGITGNNWSASSANYLNIWEGEVFTRISSGSSLSVYTATADCEVSICFYDNGSGVTNVNSALNLYFGMWTVSDLIPTLYYPYFEPYEQVSLNESVKLPLVDEKIEISEAKSDEKYIIDKTEAVSSFENTDIYTVGKFYSDRNSARSKYVINTSKNIYLSKTNGNDANNGLTTTTAVATINRANTLLIDGDTLLIERGSVFTDPTNFTANQVPSDVLSANGLKVDAYGDIDLPKPMFNNMKTVPHSSWILVNGYTNVYKYSHSIGANVVGTSATHMTTQVMVDGVKLGSTITSISYTTLASALAWLEANPNNHWNSTLDNNGYTNGWVAGTYDYYISLSNAPISSQLFEVSNNINQLFTFTGVDIDVRNIAFRGNVMNAGLTLQNGYYEGLENYDFLRHGCLFEWVNMLNCKMISRGGGRSGFVYHHYAATKQKDLVFIGCEAITKNGETTGNVAFGGHGTAIITDNYNNFTYDKMVIKGCYVEGCNAVLGSTITKHNYLEDIVIKDVRGINTAKLSNVYINKIIGNILAVNSSKITVVSLPNSTKTHSYKNCFIKTSLVVNNGLTNSYSIFLFFADADSGLSYGNLIIEDSYFDFYLNYTVVAFATYQKTFCRLENNNITKLLIKNSLIKWKNDAITSKANLMWGATNSPNLDFENVGLANITNNSTALSFDSATFFDNYLEFDNQKYLLRKSYISKDRLITFD